MASNEFKKLLISEGNSFVSWVGSPIFADHELTYSFETALRGYYLDPDTGGLFLGGFVDPSSSGEYVPLLSEQQDVVNRLLSSASEDAYRVSFSDVININFVNTGSTDGGIGDITFMRGDVFDDKGDVAAIANPPFRSFYDNIGGDIWIDSEIAANSEVEKGEFGWYLILHELGHSLGLNDSGSTSLVNSNKDNFKYTIMASGGGTHPEMAFGVFPTDLQLYDIAALQAIYGADMTTRAGDTTYKIGQGFQDADTPFIYTIWDGGGNDTIDARGYADGVEIDLREGHFSSIGRNGNPDGSRVVWDSSGYDAGNVAIAYGAKIENAIGTQYDDRLIGNDANNHFIGEAGADEIHGGAGIDTLDYSSDAAQGGPARVVVNEVAAREGTVIDGFGDTDTFFGIENFTLTDGNDQIFLRGPIGQRTVDGGDGTDTLTYAYARYDQAAGTYSDISGTYTDTLISIENVSMTGGIVVMDMTQDYLFTPQYQYSYAKATQGLDITIINSGHFTAHGPDPSDAASFSQSVGVTVNTGAAIHSGTVDSFKSLIYICATNEAGGSTARQGLLAA